MARRNIFNQNSNPLVKEEVYRRQGGGGPQGFTDGGTMTVSGAIDKSLLLFGILLVGAVFAYQSPQIAPLLAIVGSIGGLITVMIASFKPHTSPITAPLTAGLQGLLVGAVTLMYSAAYDGIILQAVSLTFAVLFVMLAIYKSGLIKVTEKFRMVVSSAFMAIFVVYLLNFVLSFMGINIPHLHTSSPIGIGIGIFVLVIASLNLLVNFDTIERGARYNAPKYMEWYSGLGIIITLVWIYLEIIRLLSYLNRD